MANMTPELRRRMRHRPVRERIRLWWLLRRLNKLERTFHASFIADAGFQLSNYFNHGRSAMIRGRIAEVEAQIAKITVPVMKGEAT